MKNTSFWILLLLLILIHTVDMELTTYYIGNQWEHETFPLMRYSIKFLGIYNAIWLSRICTYVFFFVCYLKKENSTWLFAMFLITVLYYVAMADWLINLDLVKWPLPTHTL